MVKPQSNQWLNHNRIGDVINIQFTYWKISQIYNYYMKKSYYNIFINILGYEMKMKYHKLGIIDRNTRKNERSNELRGLWLRV